MLSQTSRDQLLATFGPSNVALVEELYEAFHRDPQSVDAAWRHYFGALEPPPETTAAPPLASAPVYGALLQERVQRLIEAYRERGHLSADLDPLGLLRRVHVGIPLEAFGLDEVDPDTKFSTEAVAGPDITTL